MLTSFKTVESKRQRSAFFQVASDNRYQRTSIDIPAIQGYQLPASSLPSRHGNRVTQNGTTWSSKVVKNILWKILFFHPLQCFVQRIIDIYPTIIDYCSDPSSGGGEELYTQMGFFCSVNFGRSIYSSYRVETGIIRKLVQRRIWN